MEGTWVERRSLSTPLLLRQGGSFDGWIYSDNQCFANAVQNAVAFERMNLRVVVGSLGYCDRQTGRTVFWEFGHEEFKTVK